MLEALDVIPERSGGISTAENVLVQVQTPDEILVLPGLTQTRELDVHGTVIVEHIIALAEESSEFTDTDVLTHLELGDLVVLGAGDITVVHTDDAALLLSDTSLAKSIVTPSSLVLSDGQSSNLGAVVQTGEAGQGTPATADVQHSLAFLKLDLLTDDGHLVILQLLEGLLLLGVGDDSGSVDHARAEEPGVVVVTAVVVGTDLRIVLGLGVEEDVNEESEDDELEQLRGEGEVCPIVAVFQDLEDVTVEGDVTVEIHLGKGDQGNLVLSTPFGLVLLTLEGNVVLNGTAGELDFAVGAGAVGRVVGPEGDQERENQNDSEEGPGLPPLADQVGQEGRDTDQDGGEEVVGEALISRAIGRERCIVNSCGLYGRVSKLEIRELEGQWQEEVN